MRRGGSGRAYWWFWQCHIKRLLPSLMLGLKPSRSRHVIAVAHPKHPAAAWLLYQAASDINPRVRKKRLP